MMAWLMGALCWLPGSASAQVQPRFEVRSAYMELIDDVYYLNARIDYGLSEAALEVLMKGVPLTMALQIEVIRERRYLLDDEVASLRQRYQLQFHALSERYLVRNLNSGQQTSFSSLEAAVRSLGTVVRLPVLDNALLEPGRRYVARMRAVLDIREFPGPLRLLAALRDEWRLTSEWYVWPLRI